ncbi:hypothetical protein G3N57_17145 [Paraburkholderia sp. Se-20369]|nr:hypothetical protein [Paraburkholderia sp. Se-20369]
MGKRAVMGMSPGFLLFYCSDRCPGGGSGDACAGGSGMALFFLAERRMFFLILLGRRCDEKNTASFGRELREFSRAMAAWRI